MAKIDAHDLLSKPNKKKKRKKKKKSIEFS